MTNLREINVLNILWKSEKAMTSTEVVNEMKGLTQSTVISVLRKLLENGWIEVAGITHSGKVLSRTYQPTETSKRMLMEQFIAQYERFVDIIPVSQMCGAILRIDQEPDRQREELVKLKGMLKERG